MVKYLLSSVGHTHVGTPWLSSRLSPLPPHDELMRIDREFLQEFIIYQLIDKDRNSLCERRIPWNVMPHHLYVQSNLGDSNAEFLKPPNFSNLTVSPDLLAII